jgi:hypothetical protein
MWTQALPRSWMPGGTKAYQADRLEVEAAKRARRGRRRQRLNRTNTGHQCLSVPRGAIKTKHAPAMARMQGDVIKKMLSREHIAFPKVGDCIQLGVCTKENNASPQVRHRFHLGACTMGNQRIPQKWCTASNWTRAQKGPRRNATLPKIGAQRPTGCAQVSNS